MTTRAEHLERFAAVLRECQTRADLADLLRMRVLPLDADEQRLRLERERELKE